MRKSLPSLFWTLLVVYQVTHLCMSSHKYIAISLNQQRAIIPHDKMSILQKTLWCMLYVCRRLDLNIFITRLWLAKERTVLLKMKLTSSSLCVSDEMTELSTVQSEICSHNLIFYPNGWIFLDITQNGFSSPSYLPCHTDIRRMNADEREEGRHNHCQQDSHAYIVNTTHAIAVTTACHIAANRMVVEKGTNPKIESFLQPYIFFLSSFCSPLHFILGAISLADCVPHCSLAISFMSVVILLSY